MIHKVYIFHMIGLKHDWMLKSKSFHHLLPQSTLGCPSVFASCLSTSSLPVLQEFSLSGEKKSCYLQRCEEVVVFKILEQSVLSSFAFSFEMLTGSAFCPVCFS